MPPALSTGYLDSPDGEDIPKKLAIAMKPAAWAAFYLGTCDVMLFSHPKGYLQTLGRYAYIGWPILAATGAFVLTHNMVGSVRQKDDRLNWFCGGAVAGAVFGVWRKRMSTGFNLAMAGGTAALVRKHCWINGYSLMPEIKPQHGGLWSCRQDWTLTKQRPGNWVTSLESK